jgi:hypothetical protein
MINGVGRYVGLDVSNDEIVCVGKYKEGKIPYEGKFSITDKDLNSLIKTVWASGSF